MGYDYCYALPPAECPHFEFVSSSCFCCEAPFTNKEHVQAVTPGPLLHWDNGHSLNEWRPYNVSNFEVTANFRTEVIDSLSLQLITPAGLKLLTFVRFREFRLSVHSGSTEQATKERGADVSGTFGLPSQFTRRWDLRKHNFNHSSSSCSSSRLLAVAWPFRSRNIHNYRRCLSKY